MASAGRHDEQVFTLTDAPTSRSDDIRQRQRRYLFSMAIRVVCFVGAIVTGGWVRWALVAGALVLPYIAVVMANVASPSLPGTGPERPDFDHPQLPEGTRHADGSTHPGGG